MGALPVSKAEVRVQIWGDNAPDELRSLAGWLSADDDLRRQARLVAAAPPPGAMGAGLDHLAVALGPGGLAAAFAAVLVAWIRSRSATVSIELTRPDGTTVRLEAKNVRGLPHDQVKDLTDQVAGLLARAGAGSAGPDPAGAGSAGADTAAIPYEPPR
jgi:Effector Associated Constant Component 1